MSFTYFVHKSQSRKKYLTSFCHSSFILNLLHSKIRLQQNVSNTSFIWLNNLRKWVYSLNSWINKVFAGWGSKQWRRKTEVERGSKETKATSKMRQLFLKYSISPLIGTKSWWSSWRRFHVRSKRLGGRANICPNRNGQNSGTVNNEMKTIFLVIFSWRFAWFSSSLFLP